MHIFLSYTLNSFHSAMHVDYVISNIDILLDSEYWSPDSADYENWLLSRLYFAQGFTHFQIFVSLHFNFYIHIQIKHIISSVFKIVGFFFKKNVIYAQKPCQTRWTKCVELQCITNYCALFLPRSTYCMFLKSFGLWTTGL